MRNFILSLLVMLSFGLLSTAYAVPPGMSFEFTKSPMGVVKMDGKVHIEKGVMCDGCHPKIFEQKKGGAVMNLADHQAGTKFCFACHNGKKAFASKDNCAKCHKMM